jgi:hypothetical protein
MGEGKRLQDGSANIILFYGASLKGICSAYPPGITRSTVAPDIPRYRRFDIISRDWPRQSYASGSAVRTADARTRDGRIGIMGDRDVLGPCLPEAFVSESTAASSDSDHQAQVLVGPSVTHTTINSTTPLSTTITCTIPDGLPRQVIRHLT